MSRTRCLWVATVVAVVSAAPIQHAQAVLIGGYDVMGTFNYIDARTTNTVGTPSGVRITFGIDVAPVGIQPTPSLDGTTVTATQGGFRFQVPYEFTPAFPYAFGRSVDFAKFPALTGSWTLSLSNPTVNGGVPASVSTQALVTKVPPPFVSSVLLTPDPAHPT